jgi:hypothetical protein
MRCAFFCQGILLTLTFLQCFKRKGATSWKRNNYKKKNKAEKQKFTKYEAKMFESDNWKMNNPFAFWGHQYYFRWLYAFVL